MIILTTLNARYSHSSIGLRYLFANLKELQQDTKILEFVINENILTVAEQILAHKPKIVGIGVYIWNASDTSKLVNVIKKVSPNTIVVVGGPEVSYFPLRMNFEPADYIIQNEGEIAFYNLCRNILDENSPKERVLKADILDVKNIELPYKYYTDEDIANRRIYFEASRGCPFLCEFCLSSIDKNVRYFDTDIILNELEILWQRGARSFKFIDRTFNLNIEIANKLIDFFLSKEPPYFAHFEVIPEVFPDELKQKLELFADGALQLEVGIQTLDKTVAKNISRPLRLDKIKENLQFLQTKTKAHLHVDLIVGLPGESLQGFAKNLNDLCRITNDEIQIGILKKLSGTKISRHDEIFGMVYSDEPPYDILCNSLIDFETMQKLKRFARFWDVAYNSDSFESSVRLLWSDGDVFSGFWNFCEHIYAKFNTSHNIHQDRFAKEMFNYLVEVLGYKKEEILASLRADYAKFPNKNVPSFLK